MKKIFGLLLAFVFTLTLSGCLKESDSSTSYVSVEINPSVELVIGEDGTVLAANGTNDDGKTLIIDVKFEGKTLEEAIKIIMEEAKECGYLVSAEYNSDLVSKDVSISISSDTEQIQKDLQAKIEKEVNTFIEQNDLAAKFEAVEAKSRAYFEEIVLAYNPSLTAEEVKAMSYEDLMKNVELATIEKAQLASVALEEYYLQVKEYEFELAYKTEIANQLDFVQKVIYDAAKTALETAIDIIEEIQYGVYVSEDSQYLKFLSEINKFKDNNVKLRVQLGQEQEATEITAQIKLNEDKITEIETKIVEFMNGINAKLEEAKAAIKTALSSLDEFEKNNKIDFNQVLTSVEQKINSTKDGIFANFEKDYADDITAIKNQVEARKQELTKSE